MPRLEKFTLTVKTGDRGYAGTPAYTINGFPLEFDRIEGGASPGETLVLEGSPESYPHSLLLRGPESGAWDLAAAELTYHVAGEDPYTLRLGAVTVDEDSDLNLWYQRPPKVLDL